MVIMIMMIDKLIFNLFLFRVFPRDVVLGGEIAFVRRENVRNMPKKIKKIVIVWGGNSKFRAEIPPPLKALKKTLLLFLL